jgi:sugar O-acyltransferase (sialic acid O-acetyltransferase NeuD family)
MKDLIIFGAGKIAEAIYDYVRRDSDMQVLGFCVDAEYCHASEFQGLPLVTLEALSARFPPARYAILMAIGYHECNALRTRKSTEIKAMGYRLASYVSTRAWVAGNAKIGEGCVILDHVSIEPGARLGDNVALWSGVVVGHHAAVGDHCWLAAGATVGGSAQLGNGCFLGLNATIAHEVQLGERCLIGGHAWVGKSAAAGSVLITPEATLFRLDVDRFLRFSGKL